jgi:glycosyl hydrolase family 42 (putative beta-galactosidase)
MKRILLIRLWSVLLLMTGTSSCIKSQQAGLRFGNVPTFQLRARVVTVGGQVASAKNFVFWLEVPKSPSQTTAGGNWSEWITFTSADAEALLKGQPGGFPLRVRLRINGVVDPTAVEAELKLEETGEVVHLNSELFNPFMGFLLWRDENRKARVGTMADYNQQHYWKPLEGLQLAESQRPKNFLIADRFIGGSDDRREWREGIEHLSRAGINTIMVPASRPIHEILLGAGVRRTAWAIYNPPGYAFSFAKVATPEAIDAWAQKQADAYASAGFQPQEMALLAMSDEPAWYYPQAFKPLLGDNIAALNLFRDYLRQQNLQPAEVGARNWEDVFPIGRSRAKDLASRRLFYWSMRFFSWNASHHFANCTTALERAFYPNLPIFTNWNSFAGRFYVPGPVASNKDTTSPDAGMGTQDWFEFGKQRGGTMLWTEDWFPDNQAYQWSFYNSKLRSIADRNGLQFGGYVVGRVAGERENGLLQKVLSIAGSGGKAIQYYWFGPDYNFPGNCYSQNPQLLRKIAEANGMIGAAEDVLWPGKQPRPQVAILMPRSAQVWDAKDIEIPTQIQDATNTNLNNDTVDYMAEVFDLYLALQHDNVPVDFVDEDDLSAKGLEAYRVIYATAPNIPTEGQQGLSEWVKAGGTLVTITGTGTHDRYNEPSKVLTSLSGITEQPRDRMLVSNIDAIKVVAKGKGSQGEFTVAGARGTVTVAAEAVEATFDDGSPAVIHRPVGRGRVVHFAWTPGLSYIKSSSGLKDLLPVGFSETIRRWIVYPTHLAGVSRPVIVSAPMIETPLLLSKDGAAVTLLNWRGESLSALNVTVQVPFKVNSVESVKRGRLAFRTSKDGITFSLPLDAADIVAIRPNKGKK